MILVIEQDGQVEVIQNVAHIEDANRLSRSLIHVFKHDKSEHEGEIDLNATTVRILPQDLS